MAEPRDDVVSDLAQRVTDGEITVEEAAAMGLGCSWPATRPAPT